MSVELERKYAELAVAEATELLKIDSPTGYTTKAAEHVKARFTDLGYKAGITVKGGVIVDLGGVDDWGGLLLEAHTDTLGLMVCEIKGSGRLRVTNLGGLHAQSTEGANVRVITRDGRVYSGTVQLCNASSHVNRNFNDEKRNYDNMEVVLDENVYSKEDTAALGIRNGDLVCLDPKTVVTDNGYIKSRFLDDKLQVGTLIAYAKYLKDAGTAPIRHTLVHVTVYEEVGHGGAASVPTGVTEAISVDMGCVGDGLECNERKVSICAKDSGGPYSYELTTRLINAAEKCGADYAVDIYPMYGSDVETTLSSGHDVRHGLIGPGVYASHGYERSHIDGVYNTLKLIDAFNEKQ
ncbi:MAG: M42 family metallopeptidase [Firmicutes bacterium]|nr:M42 family metallopeptidase [Candidatus Colimorpha enterica]